MQRSKEPGSFRCCLISRCIRAARQSARSEHLFGLRKHAPNSRD